MHINYLGHSGFLLNDPKSLTKVLVDPFITDNPKALHSLKELDHQYLLITHGHSDHLGDSIALAKKYDSTIIANFELANYCKEQGCNVHPMQIGGSYQFDNLWVKLTMALHSSSIGQSPAQFLGNPAGFVLKLGGLTIYHAGDTGLFGDMSLIGRLNSIDVAMLPIGDNFTMGPEDALEAVKMLHPKLVIPMHYNTWEVIAQDPLAFKAKVENFTAANVKVLSPGESLDL
jgi:L-ascorbate metabolism protein UlaG (beta-lactamase superfamily)